jgi:molybdopterin-guanine dinucleotide biosynthesis protein A
VGAPGQELPALPAGVVLAEDAREGRGPLEGMAAGLRALAGRADLVYVSPTDVPLLRAAFVRRVVSALDEEVDAAVPRVRGHAHPLAAAYRATVLPSLEALLAADRLSMSSLLETVRVRWLDAGWLLADPALAAADPKLDSLLNLNRPADYEAARRAPA